MSAEHSKTLLRKGALKTHGGGSIPRHTLRGKSGTSGDEEALLLDAGPGREGDRPADAAKMQLD